MNAYDQAELETWRMDHDGWPDSAPHTAPDPACPFCTNDRPTDWTTAATYTLEHNGGTFDARTGEPVTPSDGYAVGIHDGTYAKVYMGAYGFTHDLPLLLGRAAEYALAHEAAYVGTWIDGGIIHVDPVTIVPDRANAGYIARLYRQRAIWDFANGESIDVAAPLTGMQKAEAERDAYRRAAARIRADSPLRGNR